MIYITTERTTFFITLYDVAHGSKIIATYAYNEFETRMATVPQRVLIRDIVVLRRNDKRDIITRTFILHRV